MIIWLQGTLCAAGSLHVTQVGPVVDLRGDVPQLGARYGVVDGQVLLCQVR